jgi:transcriptional regulator with XRE-family HTH domain
MNIMTSDETVRENLAANLGRIIEERGLTQTALAQKTGETQVTISRILRGLHMPGAGILTRLAEALDVSIDRLVGTPPRPPIPAVTGKFSGIRGNAPASA